MVPSVGAGTWGGRWYPGWEMIPGDCWYTESFTVPKCMHVFNKLNAHFAHVAPVSQVLLSLVEDEFHYLSSATSRKGHASPGGFGRWVQPSTHASQQQVSEDVLSAYEQCRPCVLSHSVVSDSAAPWAVAHQAPLSMESSRPEYWSGQPFPSPGNLPNPGIKPRSPTLQVDSLPSEPPHQESPISLFCFINK